ncbi:Gfo/Idh/MocA family protein [Paenibacillus arenilitoris]|uniref:Gfo/Idh/MocA family oxidoreductase n=1 Tax=Paenibacillus arenilitoris TaxID=2772299 RepID=A0A927CIS3_9BACL|nr:Gfo/Idh/MocA family oxidoreductase [Paenibacillus arenilitoris]MBD2866946.1 Gfo/Idh/MocA family oxidoreductase [Paenibacillus arenilitoris]
MSNRKLKIGIIGCGGIAFQKHMPALARNASLAEMTAFCDTVEERARQAAKDFGGENAKVYTEYQELLRDESIDVVHVLTPNLQHSFITVAALEAGKHVMCEKPMAINSAEAQTMLDAAKRTGKKLTIGYQNRWNDDSQILYRACREGFLGEIYMAKAHAVRRRMVPTWGVFADREQQGGGCLIDIGTHALDLALWFMDNYKPKSVTGSVFYKLRDKPEGNMMGPWNPETFHVEDSAFGLIKMENGATIFLESSWALNTTDVKEAKASLFGTDGGAEMKQTADYKGELVFNSVQFGKLVETKPQAGPGIAYFGPNAEDGGTREARHWLECIIHDRDPLVKPEQAFVVTQILEALYQSAETGKEVVL